MTTVPDIARTIAEKHGMFTPGAPVLALVSGGADSMTLLHLLAEGTFGEVDLHVMHVNHLLRGVESDADAEFVSEACDRLGVPCSVARFDVGAHAAAEGLNLEDAGRQVRYRFADEELDALCEQHGVTASRGRIAVAHTLDDRIETFLMRAVAGSGAGGLGSIAAVRGRIVRPLISCERLAVRKWLQERGESWREDASNLDTERRRAYVRAQVVPALEGLDPTFRASLERTMDLLVADDRLLSSMAEAFARDFAEIREGESVFFHREYMSTLDPTMARRTLRTALLSAFPEASRVEAEHIEALVGGLRDEQFAHDLPYGLRASGEYDKMVISRRSAQPPRVAPGLLPVPATADLGSAGRMSISAGDPQDTDGEPDSIIIDAGKVHFELTVDGCRPGDRMRPLGMEGSRKLSDMLVDAKVPKRLRPAVPVVRDGEQIVWLAGVRMSEEYRVGPETGQALRLTWERGSAWVGNETTRSHE